MIDVNYNDSEQFKMPTEWNELTAEQLIAIAPLLLKAKVSNQEKAFIVYTLCGFGNTPLSAKAQRKRGGYDYFANELKDKLFPLIEYLFEENKLTKQLLPVIEVRERFRFFGTTALYGPIDNFDNITLSEFSDTESCLEMYEQTLDELWLNRFLAILYRPKKKRLDPHHHSFDGDVRQPYNIHLNDFIGAMLSKIPVNQKLAVLLWYRGCRNDFVESNRFLFSKNSEEKAKKSGWTDLMHSLAGPKFGTVEQTGRVLLKVIARELLEMKLQAERMETT